MPHWILDTVIYHIYPLGLCGAPPTNDFHSGVQHRIEYLYGWMDHLQNIGINTVYIGPLFESGTHGYDTADYYHVDRRLGDRKTLSGVIDEFHLRGIRVIFDAVFNHVGRNFWAFRDVLEKGPASWYCDWFQGLKFGGRSPIGDPFTYKSWRGHYSLVKLNLQNPYVKEHIFKAVEMWVNELGADGLRLDAADCINVGFHRDLHKFTRKLKPEFWLIGEIVHGDYRKWANEVMLDTVTNYDGYNSLISSLNNRNYYEMAGTLKRQYGKNGIYRHLLLYNFVDNHDVNRAASKLKIQAHLYPLYALLFTIPGIPTLYYGSEWGIKGRRRRHSDAPLRPVLHLSKVTKRNKNKDLVNAIARFSSIRHYCHALRVGDYTELYVTNEQYAFARYTHDQCIVVIVNSAERTASLEFQVPMVQNGKFIDLLNNHETFYLNNHWLRVDEIWPFWARIMIFSH